jgi:DNA topoisomerase I
LREPTVVAEAFKIAADPKVAAKVAGLRYVVDSDPGIYRRKRGKGFVFVDSDGKQIRERKTLKRIDALKIPPAWNDVWICSSPNGHLQCTGRDARRRKQYLYHEDFAKVRNETKFERMRVFGRKLPLIRKKIAAHLKKQGLPRERVLATLLALMDKTMIRVGNEEYAKSNQSYGLTTLRDRHVKVRGTNIQFNFRGKSGKDHDISIDDPTLAKVVRKCQELPGQELFLYKDELGNLSPIDSSDVNNYLREISGEEFTAKDFRTWGGSVKAMRTLLNLGPCDSEREQKKRMTQAVREAAEQLGNTLAICRQYYVHPCIFEHFPTGWLHETCKKLESKKAANSRGLKADEKIFLGFLDANYRLKLH